MARVPCYLQVLVKIVSAFGSFSANIIMKILEYPPCRVKKEEGKVEK